MISRRYPPIGRSFVASTVRAVAGRITPRLRRCRGRHGPRRRQLPVAGPGEVDPAHADDLSVPL